MGGKGRPPTPTNILKTRGSWRAKRNPGEPVVEVERPTCPAWMSAPAKRVWRELVPQLEAMRVLARVDRGALARYCTTFSRWREAEIYLADNGSTYEQVNEQFSKDGALLSSTKTRAVQPEVRVASECARELGRLEQCFGLTPSARSRLVARTERPAGELGPQERHLQKVF